MTDPEGGELPAEMGPFVGRDKDVTEVGVLLNLVRLLTLTGPGGVGKTRLALRVAHQRLESGHADVCRMIDLSSLTDASTTEEQLYTHMALALGMKHHGPVGLQVLLAYLRSSRDPLLVIDNCEHLWEATRRCVRALLVAAPRLKILATSRQSLHIDGENIFGVQPLRLPDAIRLFTEYAAASGSAGPPDAQVVQDLCSRLDGLPLAIRLAASRVPALSIRQLLSLLDSDERFRVLAEPGAHQQQDEAYKRRAIMVRVVDWSHDRCTPAERLLWARASVFRRAFGLDDLGAVCSGDGIDPSKILDLATDLVDKSVFAVQDETSDTASYYLLDTLREYGQRKLDEAQETLRIRQAHSDYYRQQLADAAARWLGPDELEVLRRVHRSLPDVLAAIDYCRGQGQVAVAREMLRNLVRVRAPFYWGFLDLTVQQLRRVLASPVEVTQAHDAADLAATASTAAWVLVTQGKHDAAQDLLDVASQLVDRWELPPLPPLLFAQGGRGALGFGRHEAIGLLAAARQAFAAAPDTAGDQHMATMMWAMATAFAGEPAEATAAAAEYLTQARRAGAPWALSWALWTSALAALHAGDHRRATDHIKHALLLQRDMNEQWGQLWSIEVCGWIIAARLDQSPDPAAAQRDAQRAARLLGAAQARQERLGVTIAGLRPLAVGHARACAQIGAVLDPVTVAAAMDAGAQRWDHGVQVALGHGASRRPSAAGSAGLTDREREIAGLIAKGLTNPQIGAWIGVAPETVKAHVRSILAKLGVPNRAAVAAWASENTGTSRDVASDTNRPRGVHRRFLG